MIMLHDYRVRQRDYLLNISRAITGQLDLNEVLRQVSEAAAEMLSGEVSLVALLDDEGERLITQAAFGVEPDQAHYFNDLLLDIQSGQMTAERLELRVRQLAKRLGQNLQQVVALPLKMHDEPMGLLLVFRPFSGTATDNDRQILQSFADQAAIAVHNARLYAAVTSEKGQLSAILEHSADGIMILDDERQIVRFNRALSQMTGWLPEAALGRLDTDVIRWERRKDGPDLDDLLNDGWAGRQTLYVEGDLERLDGLSLSVGITYALLHDEEGGLMKIIANVRDITNFRKADEMKSTFISVISHELKTPVALIKGYASTLRREDALWKTEDYQEALMVIEEEADRLTDLIENLLAASKLQAEGMRLSLTDVNLVALIERSVERFSRQTTKHQLIVDFPADFPIIQGDETRLRQVIENLLSNALKYSPDGGVVRISGSYDDEWLRISVADHGVGLRPEQLTQVFERFYRADSALTNTTKGTGLGLYLARAVIEAHGGRIWVESQVGAGSVFSFEIPQR